MENKIFILKMLAMGYLLLKKWKIQMTRPIVILTERRLVEVAREMEIWERIPISRTASKALRRDILTKTLSEAAVFYYDGSSHAKTVAKEISDAINTAEVDGKELTCLPLIISPKRLPPEILDSPFYIELDDARLDDFRSYIPDVQEFPLIWDEMHAYMDHEEMSRVLHAAVCLSYPRLKECGRLEYYRELHGCVDGMVELSDSLTDLGGFGEVFLRQLFHWLDQKESVPFAYLPEVSTTILEKKEQFFFLDARFVYCSNALFREITNPILSIASRNSIKEALVDEGILVCGLGNTYTSKMPIWNEFGVPNRPDMLRFKLDALHLPNHPEILSYFGSGADEV